jgi:leader peptidase (prepilin peptidase) / N-methyltransferase
MLSSIAVLAAGLPLAVVLERLILRLASVPFSALFQPEAVAPRVLPWQAARWRDAIARTFALSLPLLLALTALRFETPDVFVATIVVVALVLCCATDLLAYRVPNIVTMPALALVLAAAALAGTPELIDASLGLVACGGAMLLVAVLTRGGLGGGDVKLVALIGAALGLPGALIALAAGIVVGSLAVIALHAIGALRRGDVFPYAPFLSVAALIALFLLG